MGMCWWCYWGWPEAIGDIYTEAVRRLGGNECALLYGPAHVVWEDENWDQAQWCLDHLESLRGDLPDSDLAVVRWSLTQLLQVDSALTVEPADYDGENPQNFPPPQHWNVKGRP